jgi:hypothetical protein
MLIDTPEALSYKRDPPAKSYRPAMSQWKAWLMDRILEHLQRPQWEFSQKEPQRIGAG